MKFDTQHLKNKINDESTWINDINYQLISLRDMRIYRFRINGKLVKNVHYLNAYIEQMIIMDRLYGNYIPTRILDGSYKYGV